MSSSHRWTSIAAVACFAAAGAGTIHLAWLLFTGGYELHVAGVAIGGDDVVPAVTLISILLIAAVLLSRRITSLERLSARGALVVGLVALIAYVGNGRTLGQGDTVPASYIPLSLLREGNFDLQEMPFLYAADSWCATFFEQANGRWISKFPVGAAIVATPVYLLSAIGHVPANSAFVSQLEKLSAAIIAVLSVLIVHASARRLTSLRAALVVTLVYAFGTSTFSVSSQALWQHGPSQLSFASALYCLIRAREEPRWAGLAGLPLSFAVIARPTDALLAAPIGIYTLIYHRRQLVPFMAGGILPVVFQLWYNDTYYGTPFHSQFNPLESGFFGFPLREGLLGILASPSRGLLVYSPVLIVAFIGLVAVWRRGGHPLLRAVAVGTVMGILLYGKFFIWWAGYTYGPRYMADFLPGLSLLLIPVLPAISRRLSLTLATAALLLCSVVAHSIGVYVDENRWNTFMDFPGISAEEVQERLWRWNDNQLFNPIADAGARALAALRRMPTSATGGARLNAEYRTNQPGRLQIAPGTRIPLRVTVRNVGDALWLKRGPSPTGLVNLGWFWIGDDGKPVGPEERFGLSFSVLPGHAQELLPAIAAPAAPGHYMLEWGLVSEGVTWMLPRNRIDVTVGAPSAQASAAPQRFRQST
jgi:hypothetical protein